MSFPLPLISLIWIFLSIHVCFAQIKQPASFFYSPPAGGTNVSLGTSVMVNWTTNWRSSDGGNPWISLAVVQANGAGNWLTQPLLSKNGPPVGRERRENIAYQMFQIKTLSLTRATSFGRPTRSRACQSLTTDYISACGWDLCKIRQTFPRRCISIAGSCPLLLRRCCRARCHRACWLLRVLPDQGGQGPPHLLYPSPEHSTHPRQAQRLAGPLKTTAAS